jgi:hypothetical protein
MAECPHDVETEMFDLSGLGLAELSHLETAATSQVLNRILGNEADIPDPLLGGPDGSR